MNTKPRTLPLTKRGMSFETVMWLFTRLSALAMHGFILIGLVGAIIMGAQHDMTFAEVLRWALMPNVYHVENTNIPEIAPWASAFWKLVASGFLVTAVAHGVHGVIVILDDYFATAFQRQLNRFFVIAAFVILTPLGLYLIWTA